MLDTPAHTRQNEEELQSQTICLCTFHMVLPEMQIKSIFKNYVFLVILMIYVMNNLN